MKLTSKGRNAVMAMADLAKNNVKEPTNLSEISLRQGISISFLEQIFLKLKKNNLVRVLEVLLEDMYYQDLLKKLLYQVLSKL